MQFVDFGNSTSYKRVGTQFGTCLLQCEVDSCYACIEIHYLILPIKCEKLPSLLSAAFSRRNQWLHKMTPGIHLGKRGADFFSAFSTPAWFWVCSSWRAMAHETQIWGAAPSPALTAEKAASVMQRSSPSALFEVMAWICCGNTASSTQLSPQRAWRRFCSCGATYWGMHQTSNAWGMWNVMRPGVVQPSQSISN